MPNERRTFSGFRVKQRHSGPSFFVFAAPAREVIAWATVDRVHERPGGIQRRLNAARRRSVQRFFSDHAANIIPTSTVLAFKPGTTIFEASHTPEVPAPAGVEFGTISFVFEPTAPELEKPAFVVDGQHRLFGLSDFAAEQPPLLISALLDADTNEQAFQFIVINNKASKVPPDLVKSLLADLDEEELDQRLRGVRISLGGKASLIAVIDEDPDSPLRQMVDWERRRGTGIAAIKPAALEGSVNYIRRHFFMLGDDEDEVLELFFAIWRGVTRAYPTLVSAPFTGNLFGNAGFRALTELIVDELVTLAASDFVNEDDAKQVEAFATKLANHIPVAFWQSEWVLKSLDTSAGREIIKTDLRRVRQNVKDGEDWDTNIAVLASPSK